MFFWYYSQTQKGYRCYNLVLRRYFTSANVSFLESIPYFFDTSLSVSVILYNYFYTFSFALTQSYATLLSAFPSSFTSLLMLLAVVDSHASFNFVSIFRSWVTSTLDFSGKVHILVNIRLANLSHIMSYLFHSHVLVLNKGITSPILYKFWDQIDIY